MKVDNFINKLRVTKEIAIHPDAANVNLAYPNNPSITGNIFDGLTNAMHKYETGIEAEKMWSIDLCLFWIIAAETRGFIIQSPQIESQIQKQLEEKDNRILDLEQKLLEAEQSHDALVEEHNKIRDELLETQAKLDECNDKFDKVTNRFAGRGEIQP
jgi:hypothetical protein